MTNTTSDARPFRSEQIKFEPGLEKTRIIAITGLPDEESLGERAFAARCEAFYEKPIDPVKLEELLGKPTDAA